MYLNNWKTHAHLQGTFHIAACTLLLFSIAMLAGCSGGGTQTDNKGRRDSNSDTPTPSPSVAPKTLTLADTPIDVSGGSIHLEFPGGSFPETAAGSGIYQCSNCSLVSGSLFDDNDVSPLPDASLGINATDEFTITLKIQRSEQIEIHGIPAAKTVSITIDDGKYQKRTNSRLFHRGGQQINEIDVTKKTGAMTSTDTYKPSPSAGEKPLPKNGKLSIELILKDMP
ncbi:MAG TPA: hypothetical protein VF779_17750 [Pyrinomonadaceae bacterium]